MKTQLTFNNEAREKIKRGIDIAANAVKSTIGPRGRNVAMDNMHGTPTITNDGVSILKRIQLEDRYEQMGVEILKEAASKTNDAAGDGTSTTTVLLQALITEGMNRIEDGVNVVELKNGMEEAAKKVVKKLEESAHEVRGQEDIKQIATISAESEEMGTIIAEAIEKIGPDGVITVEQSPVPGITSEVVEGMQFDKGYISPYMVTNPEKMEAVHEGVRVLLYDGKLNNMKKFMPLLEKLAENGRKELVIVAEEVEGEVLSTLVVNKLRGALNITAVKAPGYGDNKTEILEDIASLIGGKVVADHRGIKLEEVTLEMLGVAGKVIVSKDSTTIVEGKGDTTDRVAQIKALMKDAKGYEKEMLQKRVADLTGGIAVIKVGASTETEMNYLKLKLEDAVNATQAAVEEGVVAGGGIALFTARTEFPVGGKTDAEEILSKACMAPFAQIVKNAGLDPAVVGVKLTVVGDESNAGPLAGFDTSTGDYVKDMIEAGIIDPLKVTKNALLNAVSAAGTFLTTEVAIANIVKEEK